jgi:hypothetical protein
MTATINVPGDGSRHLAAQSCSDIAASLLALMATLEISLEASRKSLLALDLAGLAARTREQVLLSRELAAVLNPVGGASDALPAPRGLAGELGSQQLHIEQIQVTAKRIIAGIQLQYALLARSRTKLRVMANMLAGPSAAYGPTFGK